ncbi:aminotransferase class I/II-fold pyridoxal phosphate-dependent enzyme [Lapillicoccus sp.]|uniref:DegT/DnrJ/EryC1/StrS family aminotransferase n=1 Tax=Lapillicoccus sp. TaxID=1909287 RepID=UPI00326538BC
MTRILLSQADVTELEEKAVTQAVRSGWVTPLGPDVDAFEAEVADRVGVAGALALSSGTAALHLALLGVGARPGRVVLVPTLTFAASANAVVQSGATPVFVDCLARDGNVDPALLVAAADRLRDEGEDVAAVMTVDLFGQIADHASIAPDLERRGIPLVEDAAESLGATRDGRDAGSFGAVAALSFNGNKIMTTSGGGMLLSDDTDLVDRARYLSTQARQPVPWYEHTEVGFNYRLSNILAALGRAQLSRLDEMIGRRRAIRVRYASQLADLPGLRFLGQDPADPKDAHEPSHATEDNCWLTVVVLGESAQVRPAELIAALAAQDIEARHVWKPMHLQPVFAGHRAFTTGVAESLFDSGVTLPSGSALADDDIDRVAAAVLGVLAP